MKIHRTKILPRLKPKPVMHIAGKADDKVPFEAQVHTVEDFRQLNQCGDGKPWQKECTLYPSKIGDPVVMLVHRHGHELPHEAPPLIVKFFKDHTLDGHGKKGLNSSDTHAENDVRVRGSFPFGT
jgi:polyhydroxybutyrate depolymerase